MKPLLKFSGVKAELDPASAGDWSMEFRPGGWVIATRTSEDGRIERRRFYYQRTKDRFTAKILRNDAPEMTDAIDFYGQRVEPTRGGAAGGGSNDFTAQFPGKVRKLLVADGAAVEAGTPLLMVEAMKMEFAIKAETAGKVKKFLVQEGQQLSPGQKLLDFEPAGEPG